MAIITNFTSADMPKNSAPKPAQKKTEAPVAAKKTQAKKK